MLGAFNERIDAIGQRLRETFSLRGADNAAAVVDDDDGKITHPARRRPVPEYDDATMEEGDGRFRFDEKESATHLDVNDDDYRMHDRTYDATSAEYPEQRDGRYFDQVATGQEESERIVIEEEWEAEEEAVERMDREREWERRSVEAAREEAAFAYRMAAAREEGAAIERAVRG